MGTLQIAKIARIASEGLPSTQAFFPREFECGPAWTQTLDGASSTLPTFTSHVMMASSHRETNMPQGI